MIPSAYNLWKSNETVRQWFEVTFDTSVTPPKHSGYVCKCCWEQFSADGNAMDLLSHAEAHGMEGEFPYMLDRPSPITGEEIVKLYKLISENFEPVMPVAGTWKFQCLRCEKLLPHRTAHKKLMHHAQICAKHYRSAKKIRITNPEYISQEMFDRALREKFHENPGDSAVRQQAVKMWQLVTGSQWRNLTLRDIAHAARISGHTSKEQMQLIAYCMGMQVGFELGFTYPPVVE